jgi:phosphoglycerate dehydrogenase-like enzyme
MKPGLHINEKEHFGPKAMERLSKEFEVDVPFDASVVVSWVRLKVPDLYRFPSLKLVACNCTDTSHLPLDKFRQHGIEVLSLKGLEGLDNVHATAEHTISLMLQALRHRADRSSGRIGRELHRATICLVGGAGRVGQRVMKMLEGFECEESFCEDPTLDWGDGVEKYYCAQISDADIVSIHADLNPTSKGMVNAEFLAKLKPGAILVNTARHAIVDEQAICDWIDRDEQAIYAHDFRDEWPNAHPRIIRTPHIGGWTIESLHKTEELLAEKVIEWAKSKMEVQCTAK